MIIVAAAMVFLDTWVDSQWQRYEEIINFDRGWLAQMPDDIARQIAYGNAERLFR